MRVTKLTKAEYDTSRDCQYKEVVLLREDIDTYPKEEGAARAYARYMNEHPQLNMDDIKLRIESEEVEEDHYGNGGGIYHTAIIYTEVPETKDEIENRVATADKKILEAYATEIGDSIKWLYKTLTAYAPEKDIPYYKEKIEECVKNELKKQLSI